MKSANLNFNLIDTYLELLKSLSPDNKRELISRLSNSIKNPDSNPGKPLSELYGSFISEKSADQIIAELKDSRYFNRNTEGFE
jgi:hypothetical protein